MGRRLTDRGHLWLAAAILAFAAPALLGPPYLLCSAVTVLAVLVPLNWRLVRRPFAEARRIGDALAVSAGLLALRAELLPPWLALSVFALIVALFVVARSLRREDRREEQNAGPPEGGFENEIPFGFLSSFPSCFSRSSRPLALVAVAAATVGGGWWLESGRASLDFSWDSLPVAPASGGNQFARDPEGRFFIDPMIHQCPQRETCAYVVEHQCLSVERDWQSGFFMDHGAVPTCPTLDTRRVPHTGTVIATSLELLGPNNNGPPRGPYWVTNGRLVPLVPLVVGLTGAPALWHATAVAGIFASAAILVVPTIRRRRALSQPSPVDPYRAPARPRTDAEPEDPWVGYARLVLVATTLPCVFTLVASLGYGAVSLAAGLLSALSAMR